MQRPLHRYLLSLAACTCRYELHVGSLCLTLLDTCFCRVAPCSPQPLYYNRYIFQHNQWWKENRQNLLSILQENKQSTWCFGLVWDQTPHKVWMSGPQVRHQLIQVFLHRDTKVSFGIFGYNKEPKSYVSYSVGKCSPWRARTPFEKMSPSFSPLSFLHCHQQQNLKCSKNVIWVF